ncbi:MAG: hypothetical protein ABEJ31_10610 [Haloarculaceae archaeon]
MGATTRGWAEYRHEAWADDPLAADGWRALVNLRELLGRGEAFFGSLFGVENHARFEPVAPDRGLPDPTSRIARLDHEHHPGDVASWITLAELRAVDWDAEPELPLLSSQHGWDLAVARTEQYDARGRKLADDVDAWSLLPPEPLAVLASEREVTYEGRTFRAIPRRRRELAAFDWATLWSWLEDLETRWHLDAENVRLVVWFER